jgi:hypothetical protein
MNNEVKYICICCVKNEVTKDVKTCKDCKRLGLKPRTEAMKSKVNIIYNKY